MDHTPALVTGSVTSGPGGKKTWLAKQAGSRPFATPAAQAIVMPENAITAMWLAGRLRTSGVLIIRRRRSAGGRGSSRGGRGEPDRPRLAGTARPQRTDGRISDVRRCRVSLPRRPTARHELVGL